MKTTKKTKKKQKKKAHGFTLVELLAVIVILAIIMIISIPSVLRSMEVARRKAFITFANKSYKQALQTYNKNVLNGESENNCIIYNIKNDLELSSTGDFDGWILLNVKNDDAYITLYDKEFALVAYHYSDPSLKMIDHVINKNTINIEKLNKDFLCSKSDCQTCEVAEPDSNPTSNQIIYSFSTNELFVGDKLDLQNRKYTNYLTIKPGTEELVPANETHDMVGIYSTNIDDVLTISTECNGRPIESRNNIVYLKHTVNSEGIITKTEACLKTPWGTICQEGEKDTYYDKLGLSKDPKFETKKTNLFDFFKWNDKTKSSPYGKLNCYSSSDEVYCSNFPLWRISFSSDGTVYVDEAQSSYSICSAYGGDFKNMSKCDYGV